MRKLAITLFFLLASMPNMAMGDTIPKPEVEKLYAEADVVALVKILSGDTESFEDTIYKASVLTAYKGKVQSTLYFGPYISYGVGSEYLIFLKNSGKQLRSLATKNKTVAYPLDADYLRVMYGGYSILPVGFECGFGSINAPRNGCEDSIDARTVILPKEIESYSAQFEDKSEDRPFVRKTELLAYIEKLNKKD